MSRPAQLAICLSIFAVTIRLILIDQPYVDNWSWRQSDVAAIARNYFQKGFHFAYPQIDWAGDQPGYVGAEFPVLPFIAALFYKIFGVHEWIGRIQAVVFFAASLPFLFLLIRTAFGTVAAVWATFFYSFTPLSVMTSRCFMPDMPSLSLSIVGLYFFLRWIENERLTFLFAAAIAISLALLIKLPSAIIGGPLLYLCWQKWRWSLFRQPTLWTFAVITLLPATAWYWHAHRIAENFYPHHFFGAGGIRIMNFAWYEKILAQIFRFELTPLVTFLALFGLWIWRKEKNVRFFYAWFGATLLFVIVVGYGNRHPWYQLPLVPIAAAFAGAACDFIQRTFFPRPATRIGLLILLLGLFAPSVVATLNALYRPTAAPLRELGLQLKRTTPAGSLIIAADYGDPTVFYYAERKGWHFLEADGIYNGHPTVSSDAIDDLEKLRQRGATHLVFCFATFWWLDYYNEFAQHLQQSATIVEATAQFKIYKLNATGYER